MENMKKIEFKDNWELVLFGFLFSALISVPIYDAVFVSNRIEDIKERTLSCFDYDKSKDSLRECVMEEFPE